MEILHEPFLVLAVFCCVSFAAVLAFVSIEDAIKHRNRH